MLRARCRNYLIGLGLAAGLTAASFWVASGTSLIYAPGVPMALAALADRTDGRASRLLSAHHDGPRQHQQCRSRSPSVC